jgi:ribosome-associated toxin RatA of RatAB toxin-antitoxin module
MKMESIAACTPDQVHAVIIGVARYPDFLPGCPLVQILDQSPKHLVAFIKLPGGFVFTTRMHWDDSQVWLENSFVRGHWSVTPCDQGTRISLDLEWLGVGLLAHVAPKLWVLYAPIMKQAFEAHLHKQYAGVT